ncbi:MAG: CHASE4 domain-containing protein [Pseudolabrys sp.]
MGSRSSERGCPDRRYCRCRDRLRRRSRIVVGPARGRGCRRQRKADVLARAQQLRRVLREAENVASSDGTIRHIRQSFNYDWVNQRVGAWLEAYFDHDYIFVFDSNDRLIYSPVLAPNSRP